MHSIHNHAAYWLASIAARLVYELVAVWSGHRPLLQALLVPLTALALFFVWTGPNPCWKILGSRMYYVVAGCLLMTSGKPIYDVFGPDVATERAAHVLLGFTILGVLEPIRQNKRAIEPCFPIVPRVVLPNLADYMPRVLYAEVFTIAILTGLVMVPGWVVK